MMHSICGRVARRVAPSVVASARCQTMQRSAHTLASHNIPTSNNNKSSTAAPMTNRSTALMAALCCTALGTAFYLQQSNRTVVHNAALEQPPAGSGLSPSEFRRFTLKRKHEYNHNSNIYSFDVPSSDAEANALPVSSCVMFKYMGEDGKPVVRPYTPIATDNKGELTFLIKEYPTGKMSKHLAQLKLGEQLEIKGPFPKRLYKANELKRIGMIAGGTGITPMLQVIEQIISNPQDKTKVDLLFANTSPKDILLREAIDRYATEFPDKLSVHYIVDKPDAKWKGLTGYIDDALIKQKLPPPSSDSLIYVCGPPPMVKLISGEKKSPADQGELTGLLATLGYSSSQVFKF